MKNKITTAIKVMVTLFSCDVSYLKKKKKIYSSLPYSIYFLLFNFIWISRCKKFKFHEIWRKTVGQKQNIHQSPVWYSSLHVSSYAISVPSKWGNHLEYWVAQMVKVFQRMSMDSRKNSHSSPIDWIPIVSRYTTEPVIFWEKNPLKKIKLIQRNNVFEITESSLTSWHNPLALVWLAEHGLPVESSNRTILHVGSNTST